MFNKPQYKVGDAVCISWLGMKKYGFIIKIKKSHEEVAYFVRANDTTYPCGIKIKEYTTKHYSTGLVQYDCAESQEAIARQAATSNTRVVTDSNGKKIRAGIIKTGAITRQGQVPAREWPGRLPATRLTRNIKNLPMKEVFRLLW